MLSFIFFILCFLSCSDAANWNAQAKDKLTKALKTELNTNLAKNIILFIGDGLGISTVTASRIYKGQKQNKSGEETILKFEDFPHVALSKIYGVDRQVPDSAQTATALMCGVKTNNGVVGMNEHVKPGGCDATNLNNTVYSILHHFNNKDRSTGVVTTARLTHATPAAAYAHSSTRRWESDGQLIRDGVVENCTDIAYQLVYDHNYIQVAMGGGRTNFYPNTTKEPEYNEDGRRQDGLNLTSIWEDFQTSQNRIHKYVWNKEQFDAIDPMSTDSVLGLFENNHMQFEVNRNTSDMGEPSLAEMTTKAIQILKKNNNGFFLMVEGGRIDHAHHETKAAKALEETLAFEDAVIKALELTDDKETLIIVTADHSHVFTIGGYTDRGNDILGLVKPDDSEPALDGMPYTTLAYANGPGINHTTGRDNLTHVDTGAYDYMYQSAVPVASETHSGEDVPIFATGPMSHLINGVQEQNYVAHVMQYAACVGDYANDCDRIVVTSPGIYPANESPTHGTSRDIILFSILTICLSIL